MIFGIYHRRSGKTPGSSELEQALGSAALEPTAPRAAAVSLGPVALHCASGAVLSEDGLLAAACVGRIYDGADAARAAGLTPDLADDLSRLALELYRRDGPDFARRLNGRFAFAIWDAREERLVLGRDRLGIEPLYLCDADERVVFGSTIAPIRRAAQRSQLSNEAVGRFLLFNYNIGLETFFQGISRLRPAHTLVATRDRSTLSRYWDLSFASPLRDSEDAIADELRERMRGAVHRRMDDGVDPGVFLSGGMDSSSVIGFAREKHAGAIEAFSYRCQGAGFDESHYAKLMAESVGANHHMSEYSARDVLTMPELVRRMQEPFCDVGINIGTWILGRSAEDHVSCVLTGDGGDELFASHPIYEADKISRFVDPLPNALKWPFLRAFRALPDSDQKKNLTVKLKRFGESLSLPAELLSHRWRTYYEEQELRRDVFTADTARALDFPALYRDVLAVNAEARDGQLLNRCLYSDYQTIIDFYLRRNDLIRSFGIEIRYPLFDHELVEYCARIPLSLKIRGWFDTKYIMRKAMEPVLPREIVFREDKLGHSIPLKNWLRDDAGVKAFVLDHLDERSLQRRGIIQPAFVKELIDDHMAMRRNNSHRLWSLAVLEMWLREHVDT